MEILQWMELIIYINLFRALTRSPVKRNTIIN